jgi:hypothetical protein
MSAGELHDDDPLDALRDAWRTAAGPDPERGADDDASAAVAAWLRGAWDVLEAPAVSEDAIRRLAPRGAPPVLSERRAAPVQAWVGVAAAAAILLWAALGRAPGGGNRVDVASATPTANENASGPTPDLAPIEVTDVTPARMELRSGPVRLVLLNEWTDEASETETR